MALIHGGAGGGKSYLQAVQAIGRALRGTPKSPGLREMIENLEANGFVCKAQKPVILDYSNSLKRPFIDAVLSRIDPYGDLTIFDPVLYIQQAGRGTRKQP